MPDPAFEVLGDAPFATGFERATGAGTESAWRDLCTEIGPRVWAFSMLTPGACERLLADVDRRVAEQGASGAPNSMHGYGAVLGDLGLDGLLQALVERLAPLCRLHFEDTGGGAIDGRHGFLAEYGRDHDDSLGFHVDDSAVTLNLCLGEDFSGSELYFQGLRCDRHRQTPTLRVEDFELEHVPGTAILHAGRHRHGVHPIRRGRRRNLILWMQSRRSREAVTDCPSWCGARDLP